MVALADDSGLCVDALDGRPGIHSARWALVNPSVAPEAGPGEVQGGRDFTLAMQRVQDEIQAADPEAGRNAHFTCALCVCWPDGRAEIFEGRLEGPLVCRAAATASATIRCSSRSATI
jgi:XTP/dITP diphosphohydrolase